jgi:predicted Zn-dependent protease
MRNKLFLTLIASIALTLTACVKSPTGRNQLMMMPDNQLDQMGAQAFTKLKQKTPTTKNANFTNFVNCIAGPITQVVGGGRWEIVVFQSKELNAFALPGNKIGVYTGLVNMVDNQDQLAAVIGHEIGHVLAKHSNERMSNETLAQQVAGVAGAAAGLGQLGMAALGMGVEYGVLLPYSRSQESEADVIGLDLMARAGFNPRQSINLWQKMSQASGGQTPPEFMSTHPADSTRMETLNKNMPGALQKYQQAQNAGKRPTCSK